MGSGKGTIRILLGDCVSRMREMADNSVDAVATDPPYGLKFMGKAFDNLGEGAQQREWHRLWLVEAYRVLKPGGRIAAFSGSRTRHHLVAGMVDAGFHGVITRAWGYGSGFPKNKDVYRFSIPEAITRAIQGVDAGTTVQVPWGTSGMTIPVRVLKDGSYEVLGSGALEAWKGYGTALKPAYEPCVFGVKPG